MSITDELRNEVFHAPMEPDQRGRFKAIADRIDAEHAEALSTISRAAQLLADAEKDRDENYANWQDCKQKVLQHNITMDELSAEIGCLKDELAHRIELPKDADGVPIHIGDVMEWMPHDKTYQPVIRVVSGVGADVFFAWSGCKYSQYDAQAFRHHEPPTVEGLLREFALACEDAGNAGPEVARLAAEYAKRLKLAGEGE